MSATSVPPAVNCTTLFDAVFEKIPPSMSLFGSKSADRSTITSSSKAVGADASCSAAMQDLLAGSTDTSWQTRRAGGTTGGASPPPPAVQLDFDEESTLAALRFAMGEGADDELDDADDDEHNKGDANDGSGTGTAAGGGGSTERTADPYRGFLVADSPERYRGICRLFHQQRGFGFIAPIIPKIGSVSEDYPDLFFLREDIAFPSSEKGENQKLDSFCGALRALCVGEQVEFNLVPNKHGQRKFRAVNITGPNKGPVLLHSPEHRQRGVVRYWSPEAKYGFIAPNAGGRDYFFHGSAVCWDRQVPVPLQLVEVGFVVEYTPVAAENSGGGSSRGARGKNVAVGITAADFAPIDPATVPRSSSSTVLREVERKRRRVEEAEATLNAPMEPQLSLCVPEDELYATW